MKHMTKTLNTKRAFAASLKKLLRAKPLSKITVSELIDDCGVNRKTFYYHFEDIYALMKWMLDNEAIEVVKQFDLSVDYKEALLFVMDYVEENDHIINCVLDSVGRDQLKQFFYNDFCGITRSIIDGIEKFIGLRAEDDFKKFLCRFYTEALAGMLVDWLQDRSLRKRQETVEYITLIFRESLPNILKAQAAADTLY